MKTYPKLTSETKTKLREIADILDGVMWKIDGEGERVPDEIINWLDWYKDSEYSGGVDSVND